ncbi:MAG TPA: acyl-CoA thioesterase, partial [Myxococcota bacterium]|nr:acyl-CoA thioesterase [Myxococcota bacterium]
MRERIGPNEATELARGVFEERIVTRGTEIDRTATVSMASVLRYFEHTRWCVMQRPLLGLIDLIDQGHFFVVRSQVVELRRRIGQGQPLVLTTRFLDVGRSTATVIHEALRERDGAVVARARVTGVWLSPSRRPARIPD